jgi:hypothetical protein
MLHFIGTVTIVGSTLTGEQPGNIIIASPLVYRWVLGVAIVYRITVQMYQSIDKVFIKVNKQQLEQRIGQLDYV